MARFAPETVAFRLARRARYLLSRVVGNRLQNSQRTRFVTRNGCRLKRLILRDTALAAEFERNLDAFTGSPHFPQVAIRYEHEVWLEYVEGSPISAVDVPLVEKIADFYAVTYRRRSQAAPLAETPIPVPPPARPARPQAGRHSLRRNPSCPRFRCGCPGPGDRLDRLRLRGRRPQEFRRDPERRDGLRDRCRKSAARPIDRKAGWFMP